MPLGFVVIFVVPAKYFDQWCSLYHLGLFERVRCLLISLVSSTKIDNEMVFDGAEIWHIYTYHWIVHLSFTVTTMCFNNPRNDVSNGEEGGFREAKSDDPVLCKSKDVPSGND